MQISRLMLLGAAGACVVAMAACNSSKKPEPQMNAVQMSDAAMQKCGCGKVFKPRPMSEREKVDADFDTKSTHYTTKCDACMKKTGKVVNNNLPTTKASGKSAPAAGSSSNSGGMSLLNQQNKMQLKGKGTTTLNQQQQQLLKGKGENTVNNQNQNTIKNLKKGKGGKMLNNQQQNLLKKLQ